MNLTLLGTGEPRPDLGHFPSASLLETPLGPWLIDCGDGALWQLLRAGVAPETVRRLIFTHLHSDHTLGYLPFVMGGRLAGRERLRVWGPARVAPLHQMYREFYRNDGGSDSGLETVELNVYGAGRVCDDPALTIDALPVPHSAEAYALRFRAGGRTVVHAGDCACHEPLIDFARGADLLVHNAMAVEAMRAQLGARWDAIHDVMATPAEAGRIARLAQVRKLVLVHLPYGAAADDARRECRTEFAGELWVGEDLMPVAVA